jgi:hypothetical protein
LPPGKAGQAFLREREQEQHRHQRRVLGRGHRSVRVGLVVASKADQRGRLDARAQIEHQRLDEQVLWRRDELELPRIDVVLDVFVIHVVEQCLAAKIEHVVTVGIDAAVAFAHPFEERSMLSRQHDDGGIQPSTHSRLEPRDRLGRGARDRRCVVRLPGAHEVDELGDRGSCHW